MSDSLLPQPPEPPAKPPRKSPAAQDQEKVNTINTLRVRLQALAGTADALTRLEVRGFGKTGLDAGLDIVEAAQSKFDVRQQAMKDEEDALLAFQTAERAARLGYTGFSRIALKVLANDSAARAAVIIPNREIRDQDKFTGNVETAYQAALSDSALLAKLSPRGYNAVGLQAELAKLAAMRSTNADYLAAQQAAKLALAQRDAAYKTLKAWWGEFNATAQVCLQDRPDLLALLNL